MSKNVPCAPSKIMFLLDFFMAQEALKLGLRQGLVGGSTVNLELLSKGKFDRSSANELIGLDVEVTKLLNDFSLNEKKVGFVSDLDIMNFF